jgi:murein DD-endopeptidase MepM/ murein hydrolase activator NlpD
VARLAGALLALLLAVPACGNDAKPVAVPSPSETPEPTHVVIPSRTPTPAATRTPSRTPSRTPAPTPAPTTASAPVTTSRYDYAFPVSGCTTSYARSHHDYPATDIFAAKGCAFVSPVAGRVDEVTYTDSWNGSTNKGADRGGLSVSVVGVDGVRYYGSHLSAIAPGIKPGVRVKAGSRLGDVGNTGSARGIATHVHFGLSWPTRNGVWWVRRGEVYPWPYLDSWRAGDNRSPADAVAAKHAASGDVPPCTSYC